ncbi:MAG: PqqD family protein [Bacteroidota bacterium]
MPKFRSRILRRWLVPLLARPDIRLHLDRFGTFAWGCCDGTLTIGEMGARMAAEFGQEESSAVERLCRFFHPLVREGILLLEEQPPGPHGEKQTNNIRSPI